MECVYELEDDCGDENTVNWIHALNWIQCSTCQMWIHELCAVCKNSALALQGYTDKLTAAPSASTPKVTIFCGYKRLIFLRICTKTQNLILVKK